MDVPRGKEVARRKLIRPIISTAPIVGAIPLITWGLARLQPAAPSVDRATVWIDTVKRGPMVREVRGLGTLVSEDLRWIPATTSGRVEGIRIRPGTPVTADTVILDLSNPSLEQEANDAALKLKAEEAGLVSLRVQIEDDALQLRATAATIEADYKKAELQADINRQLEGRGLVPAITLKQSELDAEELDARNQIS